MTPNVIVVGAGPAGAALARALLLRGADVTVIDAGLRPWRATYGAWCDEVSAPLGDLRVDGVWRKTWSTTRVVGRREHLIDRSYGAFDNDRLRSALLGDVRCVDARAGELQQGSQRGVVLCADDNEYTADLVVDARGSTATGGKDDMVGFQTAYGLNLAVSELDRRGMGGEIMTLMDWRPATTAVRNVAPPTFLYAMPWGDGFGMVEETSLCDHPGYEHADLRRRLAQRMGADLTAQASHVEVVEIAMSASIPPRSADVLRFGAAAGLVHPVTGYSVAAALRLAAPMADAIVRAFDSGGVGRQVRDAAWAALWSSSMRRSRALHRMGARIIRGLDADDIADFFDCFFDLPVDTWAPYLRVDAEPGEVRSAMLAVFRRCPSNLRRRLMSFPGELVRALVAR